MGSKIKKVVSREALTYVAALVLMFFIDVLNIFVVNSFGGLLLAALILYIPITTIAWTIRRSRKK